MRASVRPFSFLPLYPCAFGPLFTEYNHDQDHAWRQLFASSLFSPDLLSPFCGATTGENRCFSALFFSPFDLKIWDFASTKYRVVPMFWREQIKLGPIGTFIVDVEKRPFCARSMSFFFHFFSLFFYWDTPIVLAERLQFAETCAHDPLTLE